MEEFEVGANKAMWVGRGTVIAPDGANLWISMMGQLWKVAREQCRMATSEERLGTELVMSECQELVEEYKKNSKRAGYKDITGEPWPDGDEDDEDHGGDDPPGDDSWRRGTKRPFEGEDDKSEGYEPSIAETPQAGVNGPPGSSVPDSMDEPEHEASGQQSTPSSTSQATSPASRQANAPDRRANVSSTDGHTSNQASEVARSSGNDQVTGPRSTEQDLQDPQYREMLRRSMEASERLDSHRPRGGPARLRYKPPPEGPYFHEAYCYFHGPEDDAEAQEEQDVKRMSQLIVKRAGTEKDFWQVDVEGKVLRRHHLKKRKGVYNPAGAKDIPFSTRALGSGRKTKATLLKDGQEQLFQDRWRSNEEESTPLGWWCGCTEFEIEDEEALNVWIAGRKGQDDVDLKRETAKDLEEWRIQDAAEWAKVAASGAVKVLSVEESEKSGKS